MAKNSPHNRPVQYRVWIIAFRHQRSRNPRGVPPQAVAKEPAEQGVMSAPQAAKYVRAFNRAAMAGKRELRAVALPVTVRYDGEPRPGQTLDDVGNDLP